MTEWDRAHQTTRPCPAILCEAILRPAIEHDPPHSRRDAKAEVNLARRLDGRRNPDIPIGRRSLLDLLGEIKQVVGVEDGIDAAMPSINPFCSRMLSGPHRRTARPFGKAVTAFGGTVKLR